jgi:hypothetical protein
MKYIYIQSIAAITSLLSAGRDREAFNRKRSALADFKKTQHITNPKMRCVVIYIHVIHLPNYLQGILLRIKQENTTFPRGKSRFQTIFKFHRW